MACENIVGVKNILITFHDCNTEETFGPISHELATDELPTWKTCPYNNEALPGGYTRRVSANAGANINVIRDPRIPLSYYQGCAAVDIQVEYDNGIVYTGRGGSVVGDDQSDSHAVTMDMSFRVLDELLPAGQLQVAA
jgi:hypothetical protein